MVVSFSSNDGFYSLASETPPAVMENVASFSGISGLSINNTTIMSYTKENEIREH